MRRKKATLRGYLGLGLLGLLAYSSCRPVLEPGQATREPVPNAPARPIVTARAVEPLPAPSPRAAAGPRKPAERSTPDKPAAPTPVTPAAEVQTRSADHGRPAPGLVDVPATPPASAADPVESNPFAPRFRVTSDRNDVYYVSSYAKRPPWYAFTDTEGRTTNRFVGSVKAVEALTRQEIESLLKLSSVPSSSGGVGSGGGARTSARLTVRTKPRRYARTDPPEPSFGFGDFGAGYSATGIPLHVGPRGGIYHYSSGGNKVYHSR